MYWIGNKLSVRTMDLIGSVFSGLCTGAVIGWSRSSGDLYSGDFIQCALIGAGSYLLAGFFMIMKIGNRIFRVPGWVLTPVLGSSLTFLCCVFLPNEVSAWRNSRSQTLALYLLAKLPAKSDDFLLSVLVDCAIAIPIMAMFHCIGTLAERKRCRNADFW